jgi:hypothetical protein
MARFRGTIQGSRGEASRLGTPRSGLVVTADGWDLGIAVYADVDPQDKEKDVFKVYLTGGSNGGCATKCIGTFTEGDLVDD